jgi:hypothetical protein
MNLERSKRRTAPVMGFLCPVPLGQEIGRLKAGRGWFLVIIEKNFT